MTISTINPGDIFVSEQMNWFIDYYHGTSLDIKKGEAFFCIGIADYYCKLLRTKNNQLVCASEERVLKNFKRIKRSK